MAGRFVYNSAGQRVWVEDNAGGSGAYGVSANADASSGLKMGTSDKPQDGWNNLLNVDANRESVRKLWNDSANPYYINAAQVGATPVDRTDEMAVRSKQYELLNALNANASGAGPSAADGVTLAGKDAATRAMMASKGLRGTLAGGSQMQGQNALSGAAMKSGEQQNAWGALTNAAYGVRGADLTANTGEAKLAQTAALANAGFKNQATIANQSAQQAAIGNRIAAANMYGGLAADDVNARLQWQGMERERIQKGNAMRRAQWDRQDAQTAQGISMAGSIMGIASDERVKKNVRDADPDLEAMYGALSPAEYEYKDTKREGTSPGTHVSVMAQDLQKSKIGAKAVSQSPEGHLMVDYAKLMPAQVAATAWLHKRLEKLEKGR